MAYAHEVLLVIIDYVLKKKSEKTLIVKLAGIYC